MKKKPDVLVVLAAILGLGIAVSSFGHSSKPTQTPQATQQLAHLDQQ